jgi:two-component system response regulator MprA
MKLLVVEDETKTANFLKRGFGEAGFVVSVAPDGIEARRQIEAGSFDLIVLDIMLPGVDGWDTLKWLRGAGLGTPVLILTARDEVTDRVRGLELGADDYLVKPFALEELLARLRALLRRRFEGEGGVLRVGELTLDLASREAHRGARAFTLTRIEFDLLELFLRHPRQVLTREILLNKVWGFDFDSGTNSLAVYVGYLRRKTEAGGEPRCIHTVRGVGYVLRGT